MLSREQAIKQRLDAIREEMKKQDLNLLIVSRPVNVFYYSDFNPLNYSMLSFVLIPAEGEPTLLLQAIRGPRANQYSGLRNIKLYGKWSDNPSVAKDPMEAISILVKEYGLGELRVGAELNFLTYSIYTKLCKAVGVESMTDISALIDSQKAVKDELTIDRIRVGAKLANCGMDALIAALREGKSEIAACNESKRAMWELYIDKYSDYTIVGFGSPDASIYDTLSATCTSGIRTSYGACDPINVVPQKGELVLPIVTTKISGFSVENERSLYVGELDDYRSKAFHTVLEARQAVFEKIRPGELFSNLYKAAADVFIKNGFESFLPGRIGHGIGLTNHEAPSVAPAYEIEIKPGMVFTVEPGLMSASFGGVRPSDTVLATEDGYELLTNTESGFLKI